MPINQNAIFTDGNSTAIFPMLEYMPNVGYISSSVPNSVSTSATQRIGTFISQSQTSETNFEITDIQGGVRIGNITIFQGGEPADQIAASTLNSFRTGRNIKTFSQFGNVPNIRPMIRISPEGLFEKLADDKINHFASFNNYGMGQNYKVLDEKNKLIPFTDFSALVPKDLIGKKSTFAYPFVHNGVQNLDQYLDPSHPGLDGAIDVFEVRHSLVNLSISDISLYGCKGNFQGGDIEGNLRGSTPIDSKFEYTQEKNSLFFDAQEIEFGKFTVPKIGVSGSSGFVFPMPGYVDETKHMSNPYKDSVDYISDNYNFVKNLPNFLSSSRNRISELGTRFKSSTSGLVYGESNKLGTDSIAFGGLKK